jgi:hypothetical protein
MSDEDLTLGKTRELVFSIRGTKKKRCLILKSPLGEWETIRTEGLQQ